METDLLEAQILYSVLSTPEWMTLLKSHLNEVDFITFRGLFKTLNKFEEENKKIDFATVLALDKSIKEAIKLTVSTDNMGMTIIPQKNIFEERLEVLKEISAKRQITKNFTNELDLNVLKLQLENIYKKGSSRWISGEDLQMLANEIMTQKKQQSVTFHIELLDRFTGGMERSQYVIVAGRPSVGKSAFLQYVGIKNAELGKKVLFVSAEMGEEMIIKRILKTYRPETIPTTFNILIASDTGTIESEIYKKGRDFDLILVDYVQLLRPKNRAKDMYERVTNVSSELKSMATKFNLPFFCACQYSRQADGIQPTLAHLKESGALEQDADTVISLWKSKNEDDGVSTMPNSEIVRIDLLKQRNGGTFFNSEMKNYRVIFKKDEFKFFDLLI